jgi:hypothetical protein
MMLFIDVAAYFYRKHDVSSAGKKTPCDYRWHQQYIESSHSEQLESSHSEQLPRSIESKEATWITPWFRFLASQSHNFGEL